MLAPVVVFVYNRPWHTAQTLNALAQNELAHETVLYIFADGAKKDASQDVVDNIQKTREIIKSKQWCKEVHIVERDHNAGLAAAIVSGVTDIINRYGKIIVLEDDIVTSKGFLKYMNTALDVYEQEKRVFHISGYMYPLKLKMPATLFLNVVTPWGWATWKERWMHYNDDSGELLKQLYNAPFFNQLNYNAGFGHEFYDQLKANVNGTLHTWAVKWHTSIFLQQGFCLHPGKSLVNNIGFDNSGTHCGNEGNYAPGTLADAVPVVKNKLEQRRDVLKKFHEFYLATKGKRKPPHFLIKKIQRIRTEFFKQNG